MMVQITSGRGPVEVHRFVAALTTQLIRHIEARGGAVSRAPQQSPASAVLSVSGVDLDGWEGTHELVATLRGRGGRRRWFCGVHLFSEPTQAAFDPKEVVMQASRAGGPGGQHVNKTASAVRATYRGLSVRVTDQRSQQQNRAKALRLLAHQWELRQRSATVSHRQALRGRHDRLVRGAPVASWRVQDVRRGVLVIQRVERFGTE